MKQTLYTLIVSIFLTSCATIINQPYKCVTVHTTEPSCIIFEHDTINTVENKAYLKVKRKNESFSIVATTDSLTKAIRIEPKNSIMYWSNICFNYGIGMLVDMKSPKRYSYPDKVYINSTDVRGNYSTYGEANNKGELYLHLSLPLINSFRMILENDEAKVRTGVGGITLGLDYYHSKKQFIHLGISGLSGGFSLKNSKLESFTSDYISLSNNHKIGRFAIGYGLSGAKNTYSDYNWFLLIPIKDTEKSHYAFGLIFPNYFQLGDFFNAGIVFRPTFYRPNMTDKFVYEHLISIDFALKIRVKK